MQNQTSSPPLSFFEDSGSDRKGIMSWLLSTDHKRIGLMYLYVVLGMFIVGVCLGLAIRLELFTPGKTIMEAQTYNAVFTLHGVIMIFIVVIPSIPAAFGNIILPIHLGAEDVAFPRLNLFSWWLYMIGTALALLSLFTGDGPPDTGWTFYVPFSEFTTTNVNTAVFAVFILGFFIYPNRIELYNDYPPSACTGAQMEEDFPLLMVTLCNSVDTGACDPYPWYHSSAYPCGTYSWCRTFF